MPVFFIVFNFQLTSFSICNSCIIFGASSGGIYIFKRSPCQFLKLIPSKEGSASQIDISKNEKNLAVATSKGIIIIVENFIDNNINIPLIYNEHERSTVTAMKWCGDNLHIGDSSGKISVFTLTSILTKTIFQTPSAVLMQLDSSIIQIDAYSNFLLISTNTRTYLCNTEKEQYKQIGKKLRDGPFGACFLNTASTECLATCDRASGVSGIFRTVTETDNEYFSSSIINPDVKIYCARPGVRLWEADFGANVLVTHQLRNSLNQKPGNLTIIEEKADARLKFVYPAETNISKSFNFRTIYSFYKRFIVAYDRDGIYFFDPMNSDLYTWSNITDIKDIKIFKNYIYLWREDMKISILTLQPLEDLIVNTILNKQYFLCSELCLSYSDDILDIAEQSKKIFFIHTLKSKLPEINANDMLHKIEPILSKLEDLKEKNPIRKTENSITVVENGDLEADDIPVVVSQRGVTSKTDTTKCSDIIHSADKTSKAVLSLYKQYLLNKSHKNAELTETNELYEKAEIDKMIPVFQEFVQFVWEKYNENPTKWCQEQMLKQAYRRIKDITNLAENTIRYLKDAFLELNKVEHLNCKCSFPLPKAHEMKPTFYELGCKLLELLEEEDKHFSDIAYLYKYKLQKENDLNEADLTLLVQFNDRELYKKLSINFTYDTCDKLLNLFIKLKRGNCLNCGLPVDVNDLMSWTELGLLLVEFVGPQNACRLLKRYSDEIPNGELDSGFYQGFILAAAYKKPKEALNFMETVVDDSNRQKFEESMEKYLIKKYIGTHSDIRKPNIFKENDECVFCELPLSGPILIEIKKATCGHNFHNLCFSYNNGPGSRELVSTICVAYILSFREATRDAHRRV
ncbi:unnamed protein product [Acanthoscelides obtectus]|uniref:RING-type domain-containing protein n=1 Tax=Acanthoscelides obtectus TaxID=200917 RepID=A0A9P0LDM0_ACAOB|nr:unnamed protein product [Acanthoscelides obtectus]CAK1632979.1 Hermansky-Pudlak syndrome 5 protein homolog [Acanthoscelides obtectus]